MGQQIRDHQAEYTYIIMFLLYSQRSIIGRPGKYLINSKLVSLLSYCNSRARGRTKPWKTCVRCQRQIPNAEYINDIKQFGQSSLFFEDPQIRTSSVRASETWSQKNFFLGKRWKIWVQETASGTPPASSSERSMISYGNK